jgi:large subunit ribosomal protein L13
MGKKIKGLHPNEQHKELTWPRAALAINPFSRMKTLLATKSTVQPKWYLIDAEGQVLGRLAVKAANIIRGRHKASYTPHVDTGDYVVIINAEKVVVTGKKEEQNRYMFFSGYVGGETFRSLSEQRVRRPDFVIKHAVKGMLPKNRLAAQMLTKLRVFAGAEHPHTAQNPEKISV